MQCGWIDKVLCKENRTAVITVRMLGVTVENSVALVIRCPGFVHLWTTGESNEELMFSSRSGQKLNVNVRTGCGS